MIDPRPRPDPDRDHVWDLLGPGSDKVTHTDLSSPYDPGVSALISRAAREASIELIDRGVYCAPNGLRFETQAEIFYRD